MDRYVVMKDYLPGVKKSNLCINDNTTQLLRRKNFLNGLRNALNILNGLERCLQKTAKYEKKLLKCKSSHPHTHSLDWWESEPSEDKEMKVSSVGNTISSRNQVDLAESWSTMSIVCLQYQYEELSKRYEALLQAYDERCGALNERDKIVARLQSRTEGAHAQLIDAHKALLSVGERYMALRCRKNMQKKCYEENLEGLKRIIGEVTAEVERTGLELNEVHDTEDPEREEDTDLLVSEIRKCNSLFLENIHLKTEMGCCVPSHNASL